MNWAQFKDPVSHVCLAGTVVASWFEQLRTLLMTSIICKGNGILVHTVMVMVIMDLKMPLSCQHLHLVSKYMYLGRQHLTTVK